MSTAEFANWVMSNLPLDTWISVATLQRRLAGIKAQQFSAIGLTTALRKARWLEEHPTNPGIYCLPAKCWLSEKHKTGPQCE